MSGATAPRGRAGRPARLSRESIVAAADRVLRDEGPEALSMRRLAKELDSTAMALYHHVRDKDELLLLVLESHAREIPRLELPDDPRQRLLAAALVLYERLAERPWIVEVLAADPLVVPSAMPMVEVMMAAAVACGHTPEQAVDVYRTLWYYIVGDLVMRANRERRQAAPERAAALDRVDAMADLDVTALPTVAAVADRWAELTVRDTHRQGLTAIVDGLLSSAVRSE
ncbi:TetR/AcrR family transcriptional regulator [Nocardia otitidiscaviarum]|uniref:TetR/AcrR family transcriptional regulator n=1 Tax=Nocardia otitidiscaviarum TaxID=1823 RepID=UPI0004A7441A|nr:TetR/AcrR family transcriptional regulator [Nocardia otitidiscaviarum]MBF6134685.1 TetR/AcrR family transcriptional regulator [Nocardia otitidiscaviarum]MBF6485689.1 TetR/AcrR family transcriptional regulator [Nocardia otitidiscaviarum]